MTYQQAVIEIARILQTLAWCYLGYFGAIALWMVAILASRARDRRRIRRNTHAVRTSAGPVRVWNREGITPDRDSESPTQ